MDHYQCNNHNNTDLVHSLEKEDHNNVNNNNNVIDSAGWSRYSKVRRLWVESSGGREPG